jgi:hypothetical protein
MAIESVKWVLIAAAIWFGIYKFATATGVAALLL